jgi:hypothetical protein
MAEAEFIARVTCRQIELVLIEVEPLDRVGRRVTLIGKLPFYRLPSQQRSGSYAHADALRNGMRSPHNRLGDEVGNLPPL